jgi:hypothetical protein
MPPKEERGRLLTRRARVLARTGRREEAISTWDRAIARAGTERRPALEAERDAFAGAPSSPDPLLPPGPETIEIATPDRGEVRLAVEWREEGRARRVDASRHGTIWLVRVPRPPGDAPFRWRFVADGHRARIDPIATRAVVDGDVIWGEGVRGVAPSPPGTPDPAAPDPDR